MPNNDRRVENLRKANEDSHRLVVECLREALYKLLETKDVGQIKVVDLTRAAGVSRGAFYRSFYVVTDVLADDIEAIADDVRRAMGEDVGANWRIILQAVYAHREKIPLLLRAGMGMEMLRQINRGQDVADEVRELRIMSWNGIVFNCILWWAERGFRDDPETLAGQLAEITASLFGAVK